MKELYQQLFVCIQSVSAYASESCGSAYMSQIVIVMICVTN